MPLSDKQAPAKKDLLPDHLAVCNQLMSIYTFHGWYICLYSTDIALIAQSNSFNHFLYRGSFYGQWEKCRFGTVQTFTIPRTTRYLIKAWGAQGETLSYDYGDYPGTYYGGKGAFKEGKFRLNKGTVLNIVVERRGGDSVEVRGGQSTKQTAAQLGKYVEDNAGIGGGGGASSGYNGVNGQGGSSGTNSVRKESSQVRKGGTSGQPGEYNSEGGHYHGGAGAGWFDQGCTRLGSSHGERGGSRAQA